MISKPDHFQVLGQIDISKIKNNILGIDQKIWEKETSQRKNDFAVFHSTDHIVLRYFQRYKSPISYTDEPIWFFWKDQLLPILEDVTDSYEYEVGVFPVIMFARLKAGCVIDRHTDEAERFKYCHKIHIPISTHEDVLFHLGKDKSLHMKEGLAYEVNNTLPHMVTNDSSVDRIHLIFEYAPAR